MNALRRLTTRYAKTDVRYTPNGSKSEHCGLCAHFVAPRSCSRVDGSVVSGGWCRLFERKR